MFAFVFIFIEEPIVIELSNTYQIKIKKLVQVNSLHSMRRGNRGGLWGIFRRSMCKPTHCTAPL